MVYTYVYTGYRFASYLQGVRVSHIIYSVLGWVIFPGYLCIIFTWYMRVFIYSVSGLKILYTGYQCVSYLQGITMSYYLLGIIVV